MPYDKDNVIPFPVMLDPTEQHPHAFYSLLFGIAKPLLESYMGDLKHQRSFGLDYVIGCSGGNGSPLFESLEELDAYIANIEDLCAVPVHKDVTDFAEGLGDE